MSPPEPTSAPETSETAARAAPAPAVSAATTSGSDAPADPIIYETGEARRTILAFVFMALAPFLISLPIMILLRGINGFWADAASAALLTALFGAWMLFLFVNVRASFRSRIALSDHTVEVTLPRWRGPSPGMRYRTEKLALADITGVETRAEIYRALRVPVIMQATSLRLQDGRRLLLGYVNENSPDPALDYPAIGREIAARAGAEVTQIEPVDGGYHVQALMHGAPPEDATPLSPGAMADFRRDNLWVKIGLAALLFGLASAGLAIDLYNAGWLKVG